MNATVQVLLRLIDAKQINTQKNEADFGDWEGVTRLTIFIILTWKLLINVLFADVNSMNTTLYKTSLL
jgi:hypothetical protein